MPTPFTHLEVAQRLLCDEAIAPEILTLLNRDRSAFLLGNIAADARNGANLTRESTHFYAYDRPITEHPWRVMFQKHPALQKPHSPAQRAFLAGYVAHLAIDEAWALELVSPRFIKHEWHTPREHRFFMLHIILTYMDERDQQRLQTWHAEALAQALPVGWLPFMSDSDLAAWRDFIAGQLAPDGHSLTLEVLSKRIMKSPEEMRAVLDSPQAMQSNLWMHVPLEFLRQAEEKMYAFTREQMCLYMVDFGGCS